MSKEILAEELKALRDFLRENNKVVLAKMKKVELELNSTRNS
jgi:hypothetical protein